MLNTKLEAEREQLFEQLQRLTQPDAGRSELDRQREIKRVSDDYLDVILEMYHEIQLSIDGNAGCALLGADLQEGVASFVKISRRPGESKLHAGRRAAMQAYRELLKQLGRQEKDLPFVW